MVIFFDVDETLISWDNRLRPGVHEVFTQLRAEGHQIYLWSGRGLRWEVVKKFDLHEHVIDCFTKPLYRHHERFEEMGITIKPDFVIDDHQEIIDAFPGVRIEIPATPIAADREMWRVYDAIREFCAEQSQEAGFPAPD